jgi:hypothetical protein
MFQRCKHCTWLSARQGVCAPSRALPLPAKASAFPDGSCIQSPNETSGVRVFPILELRDAALLKISAESF